MYVLVSFQDLHGLVPIFLATGREIHYALQMWAYLLVFPRQPAPNTRAFLPHTGSKEDSIIYRVCFRCRSFCRSKNLQQNHARATVSRGRTKAVARGGVTLWTMWATRLLLAALLLRAASAQSGSGTSGSGSSSSQSGGKLHCIIKYILHTCLVLAGKIIVALYPSLKKI